MNRSPCSQALVDAFRLAERERGHERVRVPTPAQVRPKAEQATSPAAYFEMVDLVNLTPSSQC